MQNAEMSYEKVRFPVRRTAITLLAATGAFAILTASYATADLPAPANGTAAVETTVTN